MERKLLGRAMRLSVAEGGFATAMAALVSGVFLTGFALAMGATPVQIGLLMTLPSICGIAQLAGSYWIERLGHCRSFCLWTTAASRALYLPMVLVALWLTGDSAGTKVWWIIAVMALSSTFAALGGGSWYSWIHSLIPGKRRVGFFGRRNLVNSALSFALCFAGGAAIDLWPGGDGRLGGYLAVFVAAMLCGAVSSAILAFIPAGTVHPLQPSKEPLARMFAAPLKASNFRRVTLFYTAWSLAANLSIPFFAVFYIKNLGLPMWYIVALTTLTSLAGLAANNFWTRLADRFGLKPVVLIATLGDALYPLCLVFIQPGTAWALVLIHCYGLFNAPVTFGADNFILKLAPERNNSYYFSVFKSIVGLATMVAAVLGGWLAGSSHVNLLGGAGSIGGLKMVFLLSFVGRVASLALLAAVAEPGAYSVREVILALRPAVPTVRAADEPAGTVAQFVTESHRAA